MPGLPSSEGPVRNPDGCHNSEKLLGEITQKPHFGPEGCQNPGEEWQRGQASAQHLPGHTTMAALAAVPYLTKGPAAASLNRHAGHGVQPGWLLVTATARLPAPVHWRPQPHRAAEHHGLFMRPRGTSGRPCRSVRYRQGYSPGVITHSLLPSLQSIHPTLHLGPARGGSWHTLSLTRASCPSCPDMSKMMG